MTHSANEVLRQEYEAAAKDLELFQAQTKMKGQGAITESERKLLALTLPRLDAVDGATGLTTLRAMREELGRSLQAAQGSPLASPGTGIRPGAPAPAASAAAPGSTPASNGPIAQVRTQAERDALKPGDDTSRPTAR